VLLNEEKDAFATAFVKKLLAYSLGRSLELGDRQDIEALSREFERSGYQMKPLIRAIVQSQAFQTK
jgi:hypothetical protein